MPAPFYNAIKGTTAGTPGTGALTPNAASSGFSDWSTVPTGWIGLVRYEDGSAWELTYSYWNGTTLSRASTQVYSSSTGSQLTLSSSATAALIVDGAEMQPDIGGTPWRGWFGTFGSAGLTPIGSGDAFSSLGTAAAAAFASTNYLTEQPRAQWTSATTANAMCGVNTSGILYTTVNTTAGRGGVTFVCRFGASQLPTGPRLFAGLSSASLIATTTEPSAITQHIAAFALDSTDTNIQLLVNSNAGSGTKTDTGIPLVANGWYELTVWVDPGSTRVNGLLIRLDTGAIWYGSTTTDVPTSGANLGPKVYGSLNGTNTGTAFIIQIGSVTLRIGT